MKKILLALLLVFQLSLTLSVEAVAAEHPTSHSESSITNTLEHEACGADCHDCITCHCSHQHNQATPLTAAKDFWNVSTDMIAAAAYQKNAHLVDPSPLLEPPSQA